MADAATVKLPVPALADAEKMTGVFELAATAKGLAGLEVTPEGKPLSVICTMPEKPLTGVTVS